MKISDRVLVRVYYSRTKHKQKFYIKSGVISKINITSYDVILDQPFLTLKQIKVNVSDCFVNPENIMV